MDLEVVGRHALLFDDDATAAFVNSSDALVEWNLLPIDRYDVRHLLSSLPPRLRRRHYHIEGRSSSSPPPSDLSLELELDQERYLDLPSPSGEQEADNGVESVNGGAYRSVPFTYGDPDDSTDQKNADAGLENSGFRPTFPVPENLVHNLPPTEKVHQIIARTALFVSKHGGQSEIVLRVKHGDNPAFGFLMPDHHLHPYFRFLVDNQELLKLSIDGKSQEDETNQTGGIRVVGALSLLGSVYGSGEDEEGAIEDAPESTEAKSAETSDAIKSAISHMSEQTEFSASAAEKDEMISKHPLSSKEKGRASKRSRLNSTVKVGKKEGDNLGLLPTPVDRTQSLTVPSSSMVETLVLEPPADIKRLVDKIIEFIMRNGRDFEGVLIEQDSKHGRFPFLLPSSKYHPYYLKVLQKAEESKLSGKSFISEKDDPIGHGVDKKIAPTSSDPVTLGSAACHDIPYDSDRKEKFKMVIGKSKKDGQDPPPKTTQQQFGVSVDAAAAAAILQAATRGVKNPNLGILPSLNGNYHGLSCEGGQASSFGTLHSSQPHGSLPKPDQNGEANVTVPVAKAIAKTAALAAASEADSSEASLTREEKLKAERLKRAKMFAAMIKSGTAPLRTQTSRGLSVEPPESGVSGTGVANAEGKEREGSSVPQDLTPSDKDEKNEKKHIDDEYSKRRANRMYRSRSKRHGKDDEDDEDKDEEEEGEEEEEEEEEEKDHKHSRKKHRSHRSSHHHRKDRHKHRKRHSSSKDRDSRHRHKHVESSDDEHHHQSRHHRKHDESSGDEHRHQSRHRHKHDESSDGEHHHQSRQRHKHHHESSDDEHHHRRKSMKRRKKSHSEREVELEEGEISTKDSDHSKGSGGDGTSRENSMDLSNSAQDGRASSQLPETTAQVPDDLRAKVRAMLLATL
ncbi:uncharacterized protein LOC131164341 [Malania oleifera]|uniref:uncharacterized protein LOC131164341 n=1 Tax=Malania oleifera TaxID=397392 RepID=UPI0025AE3387|nr:uncharacterized protein LOC131164341 [Malania oleifera]